MNIPDNKQQFQQAVEAFLELASVNHIEPDFRILQKILDRYGRLPYENLSKIIKLNRNRDSNHLRFPDEVIDDHQRFQLGGTCFSLTYFLKTILDTLGFTTDFLMADMNSGKNSHCALILHHDEKEFLIDPGYLLNRPLDLSTSNQGSNTYLTREPEENRFSLWTPGGKKIKKRYSFSKVATGSKQFFEHWKNSFHLMTMHGICLSKQDESGFVYLHNHYIKREGVDIRYKGKFSEEISEIVQKYFNISKEVVRQAEFALKENLHYDKELGYRVPKWVE